MFLCGITKPLAHWRDCSSAGLFPLRVLLAGLFPLRDLPPNRFYLLGLRSLSLRVYHLCRYSPCGSSPIRIYKAVHLRVFRSRPPARLLHLRVFRSCPRSLFRGVLSVPLNSFTCKPYTSHPAILTPHHPSTHIHTHTPSPTTPIISPQSPSANFSTPP